MAEGFRPSLKVVDYVGDLRLVEDSGDRIRLFVGMARSVEVLSRLGARFRTEPSKRHWPRDGVPWLGFEVGARAMLGLCDDAVGSGLSAEGAF